jgi:putative DNA methylase
MRVYRRRLPHWDAVGVPTFVTFRLHGSLPAGRAFDRKQLSSGEAFVAFDRLLDSGQHGPTYLRRADIAGFVQDQLQAVEGRSLCRLHSYVIMPNHVHILWTPDISQAELLRVVKGPTAVAANRMLGQEGTFWQGEYFDRLVRDQQEFSRIENYIQWNPVKAMLARTPEEFRWSSVWRG